MIWLYIVLGLAVAVSAYAATRPDTFRVERKTFVQAAPETVHALVNDFHKWVVWSPFEKLDPDMKKTFGGPSTGVGSNYAWEGKGKAGAGRMEITESTPARIVTSLQFLKPFPADNTSEFLFEPKDGGVEVVWAIFGKMAFPSKVMCLFFNMDKMVGRDFEEGLATLKAAAKAA